MTKRVGDARQVYKKFYGSIPKDVNGRTYEIHHLDGNHNNNSIENLKAVSINEHYNIHFSQGDYSACLVMSKRMKITPEEKSKLASIAAIKRVADGTHHWKSKEYSKKQSVRATEQNKNNVKLGTHPWLNGNRSPNITAHLKGPRFNMQLLESGRHPSQMVFECPHCLKIIRGKTNANRWHFDKCKERVK